ncbi:hypothetical protein HOP52_03460 [Halomonas campisalis]|uniref:Uncharacterized protein n=1 Tax=Billgrantia campisalis TaxID=74661 RepID=A0ABS9P6V0_9GAMM|nr:hypothetical protein [Halomonas campisalis]MCG6656835.1 hypothetical protein [Halomonas campisalis]MDR5862024.1 hypothetical protein [Halomonas campisalis]
MAITTQPAAWVTGLLTSLALATAGAAVAAEGPDGYRSADFGMSSEAVMERLEGDGVVNVSVHETDDGDIIIDGELQTEGEPETDLRYVFPGGQDQLALVVAFHPQVDDHATVKQQLEARYGQPWVEELAEWWFEQLKEGMPEEPRSLYVWGGEGDEVTERGRFVRLWSFDDYLSVEYLDTQLFR